MSIKTALKRSIHTMSDFVGRFNRARFEQQSSQPSPDTAPPKLTEPGEKVIHNNARNTGALQNGTTRNGQAHASQPQPPTWDARPFSAVLGTNTHGQTVSITEEAWRQFLVLFGATGTGKTTILRNLIRQVMQAGHGLLLLEPHSDLTKQVLADVPKERLKDVVLLDLMDAGAFPFGLSLFECDNPSNIVEVAKTAAMVQHVLEKTWDVGPHTPVLAQVARHITYTMVEIGLTLSEVQLLLWDDAIRANLTSRLKNTQTRLFWQQYNAKSPRERSEYTNSAWNKLDAYLSQPLLSNILCQQHSTINLRHIMDKGQILLVLLSPQLEEFSRLIGTILLSKLLFAAFSRAGVPEQSRRPFYVSPQVTWPRLLLRRGSSG
jgi:Type IV secretion-system coupling protein DNA-binding domain